jgi:hypothetical protein
MYKILEFTQLNIAKFLWFFFFLIFISGISRNEFFYYNTLYVACFAGFIVFLLYGVSLLKLGFVTKASNEYSSNEKIVTRLFSFLASFLMLFVIAVSLSVSFGIIK